MKDYNNINTKNLLSTLTTVNESVFSKLEDKIEWIIGDKIEEALINNDDGVIIDLGFGELIIDISDNVKYKFKPSKRLEEDIINIFNGKSSSLTSTVEKSLVSKLNNVYKTFL